MPAPIGRDAQIELFDQIFHANEAQFLAIYGRRRVGKTYLVTEYFKDKGIFFNVIGIKNGNMHDQLENFAEQFSEKFYPDIQISIPQRWRDAFTLLTKEIAKIDQNKRQLSCISAF